MARASNIDDSWMLFSDAVDQLFMKYGASHHAANALKSEALAGTIGAIADGAVEISKADFNGKGEIVARHKDWPIPPDVWQGVPVFHSLANDWVTSSFTSIIGNGPTGRRAIQLAGVRLDAKMIQKLVGRLADREVDTLEGMQRRLTPSPFRLAASANGSGSISVQPIAPVVELDKGGTPLDSEKWANLVGVLGGYFAYRELKPNTKVGSFYTELANYAATIGVAIPSLATATPAIKRVIVWSAAPHDASGHPLSDKDGNLLAPD